MEVYLAGYNVDTNILRQLEDKLGKRDDLTPEVLSASYARISRDPRPISEIREQARKEVENARKSNSAIIFKMGHHSVAEHAVFNLDILGVSRLAMEELEKFRLNSYTEKSQRYITLNNDFVVPKELQGTPLESKFKETVEYQNKAYFVFYEKLKEHIFNKYSTLAQDFKKHNLLEGWAKEDARYVTSLATMAQVGETINARNLELLLRRFASHNLTEVRDLGKQIYEKISSVAPSIVLFHEANDRDLKIYPDLKQYFKNKLYNYPKEVSKDIQDVQLLDCTQDGDKIIAAALLHSSGNLPYEKCLEVVSKFSPEEILDVFKCVWQHMQFYDSMVREFEYVNFTFNIVLSAACFGQLKRHRMTSITTQNYDPNLGVVMPDSIKEIGLDSYFWDVIQRTNQTYDLINKEFPQVAAYILTNAHRRRILLRLNLRELYHISRLRQDSHSQWDIQNIALAMSREAKKKMPLSTTMLGGKDKYHQLYKDLFGCEPKIVSFGSGKID